MGKLAAVLFLSALQFSGAPAQENADEPVDKRLKELESARGGLEKRLLQAEQRADQILLLLQKLEGEKSDLEKRLAKAEKAPEPLAARVKELEAQRAELERRLAAAEKRPEELEVRLRVLDAQRAVLEKRLAEAEKGLPGLGQRLGDLEKARLDLVKAVRDLDAGRSALEGKLREAETGRLALENRVNEVDRARQELLKPLRALETRLGEVDRARAELLKPIRELEAGREGLERRVADLDRARQEIAGPLRDLQAARAAAERRMGRAEEEEEGLLNLFLKADRAGREAEAHLRVEVRKTKLSSLLAWHSWPSLEGQVYHYPFEEHFAYLGVEHVFLKPWTSESVGLAEGEGLLVTSVDRGSPADDAGLRRGDLVLRADGAPVRRARLFGHRRAGGAPMPRDHYPSTVSRYLPGETVELEVARNGDREKLAVRLTCKACGEGCYFWGGRAR